MKEKILSNIKVAESGCWEWQRSRTPRGYGRISIGHQKQDYTHRVSYKVFKDDIPEGLLIRHTCDNPCCCNPEHLELGTQFDSMQDCSKRGRLGGFVCRNSKGESNGREKLTEQQVLDIFNSNEKNTVLAKQYNVSARLIGLIKGGKTWQHVTLTHENIA